MCLWEGILRHVSANTHSVSSSHTTHIDWKTRSAPNELEIKLSLLIVECRQNSPESLDDGRVLVCSVVRTNALELVNIDCFQTTSSCLDLLPVHELQDRHIVEDVLHSLDHSLILDLGLLESSLLHKLNVLLEVFFVNLGNFITWLQIDSLSV